MTEKLHTTTEWNGLFHSNRRPSEFEMQDTVDKRTQVAREQNINAECAIALS